MNRRATIGAAIAAISLVLLLVGAGQTPSSGQGAAPSTPPPRGAPGQSADAAPSMKAFEEGMERAGRALRGLKRSAFDAASRTNDLAAIQSLQTGLLASKGNASALPMSANAKKKFGEDQAAYQTALRSDLLQSLRQAMIVEEAILEGSSDSAKAAVRKLTEIQERGHELFQNDA